MVVSLCKVSNMGNCCSCLNPSDGSDKCSDGSPVANSPIHSQRGYGTITTETSETWVPQKETERLVKSGSVRPRQLDKPLPQSQADIPKSNLQTTVEVVVEKTPETNTKKDEETSGDGNRKIEEKSHVTFAPLPHTSNLSDDTRSYETISESENSALVSNEINQKQERDAKKKKKKKHISFGVTSKVTKTAGKVKKALIKHGEEHHHQKYAEKHAKEKIASSGNFERGKLQRVSSSRMKSKYARERMEKIEKEREEKEKLKQQTQGFRDPRKAAAERGEKLGELEDATSSMRNQAAGFAQTTKQLASAMRK